MPLSALNKPPNAPEYGHPLVLLTVFSVILCLPLIVTGFPLAAGDTPFLIISYKGFIGGLLEGEIYPRWADNFYNGYGAPMFYFYPPLSFYLSALIDAASFFTLPVEKILGLSAAIVILLSSFAAYAWLAGITSRRGALAGAMIYAAAPYHYFIDVYMRGSYSEPMAYIGLPLALLCIRATGHSNRAWIGLALAYAGIICSSMSMAIVITPFLLAYAAFESRGRIARALPSLAGLLAGAGLACVYLLPAIFAMDFIHADKIWSGNFDPRNWFLCFSKCSGAYAELTFNISGIAVMQLIVTAVLLLDSKLSLQRAEKIFWGVCALTAFFMMTSLSELLWDRLPVLDKIQFPWRIMIILDLILALLTGLTVADFLAKKRKAFATWLYIASLAASFCYMGILGMQMMQKPPRPDFAQITDKGMYFTAYVPPDAVDHYAQSIDNENYDEVVLETNGRREVLAYESVPDGKKFAVQSESPALIRIRDFYFPPLAAVSAESGERYTIEPGEPAGDIVVRYPGGADTIIVRLEKTIWEKAGILISLLSAAILAAGWFFKERRRS